MRAASRRQLTQQAKHRLVSDVTAAKATTIVRNSPECYTLYLSLTLE